MLSALTTTSTAYVVPNSLNPSILSAFIHDDETKHAGMHAGISSMRKSLNWGPHTPIMKASIIDPSTASATLLSAFNNVAAQSLSSHRDCVTSDCIGLALARTFLSTLHSTHEFLHIGGHYSTHNDVYHAHFVQVVKGKRVVNADVNVNVWVKQERILSFGDHSYMGPVAVEGATDEEANWQAKVATWAGDIAQHAGQIVLDRASPSSRAGGDLLEEFSSPPFVASTPSSNSNEKAIDHEADPRHGLLAFLALQSPDSGLDTLLSSVARSDLIDSMSVHTVASDSETSPPSHSHTHMINNAPSTLEPVKASLVYLRHGDTLRLAWKYEVLTSENQYEAYVTAAAGLEGDGDGAGAGETLMVVDWVRDFRPTGGEVGFDFGMESEGVRAFRPIRRQAAPVPVRSHGVHESQARQEEIVGGAEGVQPTYRVFGWGVNAPDVGTRSTLTGSLVELDDKASPAGWHSVPASRTNGKNVTYSTTRGNNVIAQNNPDGQNSFENNYRPSGGPNLSFVFPLHWPKQGTPMDPEKYVDASVTELFYTGNELHDLFYRYGFDEAAGNFQETNFGRGGLGGDAVQANAMDGSGTNNANFATPPDGQRPRMRMYIWTGVQPYRDGDFEAGIVIHEYAHGVSTRLTGPASNSGCLGWGEAGGMGEGWGDVFATMIRMHNASTPQYTMGEWASSRVGGIRNYPYSTNQSVNLDTYASLDKPGYWGVHAIGEVWAEMLFEMASVLIAKHGFHDGLFPPASTSDTKASRDFYAINPKTSLPYPRHGNTLSLSLVVSALSLQPCRPSFADARDAILEADEVMTGGENACEIWGAFAKRGLGIRARVEGGTPWGGGKHVEDHRVPAKCVKKE